MRHLWSLLAGLIIAPVSWVLLAYGNTATASALAEKASASGDFGPAIVAVSTLGVAGLILGLIGSLRVSPVGPLLAGALFTSASVVYLFAPDVLLDMTGTQLPELAGEKPFLVTPLVMGYPLVLGVLLLVAVFSAGRWRSWPKPVLHPTVGPVNPMVDTGRIEAIKDWSPTEEPTLADAPAAPGTPTAPGAPAAPAPVAAPPAPSGHVPAHAAPEPATKGIPAQGVPAQESAKAETGGESPWAAPPTGR